MRQQRFTKKTVLVTGAGTGMGQASALRLAKEGAQLALIGRRIEPLKKLVSEIEREGGIAIAITCDITQEEQIQSAARKTFEHFGTIDAIFANAGVLGEFKALADTDIADFDLPIATNLQGTFLTIKHCLPFMASGSVLINASWTINSVMPGAGAYASSKGALLAMMRTFAIELGSRAIRVNAISPGIIISPMAEEALSPDMAARLASHAALGRNGTPEDVVGTVAWLLSDDSLFVTGQEIAVDGGFTIGGVRL